MIAGNPKNVNFEISNNDGLLTSDQVKNPTKRLAFDNILILNTKVNTIDRLKDVSETNDYRDYLSEVELFVANCAVNLRVGYLKDRIS